MEQFEAVIRKHEGIDGAYIEIPFDVEGVFGSKRVKVKASFDGVQYRGSIVRMSGCYMIGMTQELRKKIGKQPGDKVRVELEKDEEERLIELPDDFKNALERNKDAGGFFEKLSYTKKKEYIQWILEAKKGDTRSSRLEKTIILLREGKPLR